MKSLFHALILNVANVILERHADKTTFAQYAPVIIHLIRCTGHNFQEDNKPKKLLTADRAQCVFVFLFFQCYNHLKQLLPEETDLLLRFLLHLCKFQGKKLNIIFLSSEFTNSTHTHAHAESYTYIGFYFSIVVR